MDAYTGEVRIFCGSYTPQGWLDCNGQELNVTQEQVLYAVIGNQYGGSPGTTFALPNLNGCAPMHHGTGPGLTPRAVGKGGGAPTVTLTESQMPSHNHVALALPTQGTLTSPENAFWTMTPKSGRATKVDTPDFAPTPDTPMSPLALTPTGGSQPHNNMQPYLPMRFIICVDGFYPVKPS